MREHGPSAMREQLHLDPDAPECIFWRHGYIKALQDLVSLITERDLKLSGSGTKWAGPLCFTWLSATLSFLHKDKMAVL